MDRRQPKYYSLLNERLFPHVYSRQGNFTSSKIRWRLKIARQNLSMWRLLVSLGIFASLLALLYLFFPWTALPSYKDRKLKFRLVTDVTVPSQSFNGTYLLILISSAPSHFQQREAIRATWANGVSLRAQRQLFSGLSQWKIVFMLGKTTNASINARVEQEAAEFADILLGDFQDSYENLVIKTVMGLSWASRVNCTHVLKADDDVYVHIPRLITWLQQPSLPKSLYAGNAHIGSRVVRQTTSKFFVDLESYPEPYYPPYCAGPFYVLSRNILPALMNLTSYIKPILMEDAYIGMLIQSLGVAVVDNSENFVHSYRENQALGIDECKLTSIICLGHGFSPSGLYVIHSRLLAIESFSQDKKDLICVRDKLIFITEILCLISVVVVVLYFSMHRLMASIRGLFGLALGTVG